MLTVAIVQSKLWLLRLEVDRRAGGSVCWNTVVVGVVAYLANVEVLLSNNASTLASK